MTAVALPVAALVSILCTPLARSAAVRLGVVDHPGPLKIHGRPIPYLGGAAVFCGVAAAAGVTSPALLLPVALALALGLVDDIADVPPRWRLVAELGIGAVVAAVVDAGGPVGFLAAVLTVVVLINAVNLLDGMDGLAAGVTLVSALGFAAVVSGDAQTLALALAGGVGGFLFFNRPPASIYLGDGGAYALGTALAILLLSSWGTESGAAAGVAGLALVAVPVADTGVAVLRRLRAGAPLFDGDRGHVYDQLVDRGMPPRRATLVCVGTQAALGVAAAVAAVSAAAVAVAFLVLLAAALAAALLVGGFVSPQYARSDR